MTDKTNFTPDEWKLLLESVVMASMAVTAADPSGLFGLIKEGLAGGSTLAQARMGAGTNPLITAVVDAKAPSDAAAFKNWLHQLSQNVAEAASEGGGLFGIGGVPVSDAEKA